MRTSILTAALLLEMSFSRAWAAPIHETWVSAGIPSSDQIAAWSRMPGGTRTFVFTEDGGAPFADELMRLTGLQGADRLRVESSAYPSEATEAAWKALAARGAELVAMNGTPPTENEIAAMNAAGFSRTTLVLAGYPGPEEAARLAKIRPLPAITFAAPAYPRFEDRDGLAAIPAAIQLLFVEDYWPAYVHMDVFNMLKRPLALRVTGTLPPADEVQYLDGIQRLTQASVQTFFDPDAAEWKKFDRVASVSWVSSGHVPGAAALSAFAQAGGARALTVDDDNALTVDERARLEAAPFEVEWLHSAPLGTP